MGRAVCASVEFPLLVCSPSYTDTLTARAQHVAVAHQTQGKPRRPCTPLSRHLALQSQGSWALFLPVFIIIRPYHG